MKVEGVEGLAAAEAAVRYKSSEPTRVTFLTPVDQIGIFSVLEKPSPEVLQRSFSLFFASIRIKCHILRHIS